MQSRAKTAVIASVTNAKPTLREFTRSFADRPIHHIVVVLSFVVFLPPLMKIKREPTRLEKKARRGHRGYPVATVAFYGPDASRASKVAVGIVPEENAKVAELRRWTSESGDVRHSPSIANEILQFIQLHAVKTVAMSPGIIGCPHEEGIDYPEGEVCPQCSYWATRDRWTGEELSTQ